jgi:glycosyltransferase involved in cell wall biosynthesis
VNGFLTPPKDFDSLARQMAALAGDSGLRERIGRAARGWAVEHLSMELMLDKLVELYERCV